MRNILKLSITLALVAILSAVLLTGVHNLTAPIIAERIEAEYREALELFFPDIAGYESVEVGEDLFDLIYNDGDDLIGIMGTIHQPGYDGTITYNLAMDESGKIIGMRVVSHSETPGIGDVITTESFQEQFVGKNYEDPIVAGDDVDVITGATVSTSAMINSIRNITGVVAQNFLGVEAVEINIAEVPDGVYEGTAPGFIGPIVVSVEVAGGEIIGIEVLEQEETATYFVESYPLIPERIVEAQSLDVDTQTGATNSANGIVAAVENALLAALGLDVETPEEEAVEVDINAVADGVYQGSGEGFYGPITVEVEVAGGEIISIAVLEQDETPDYYPNSYPLIPERIIEEQSLDIDTATGATFSARGIVEAVTNALLEGYDSDNAASGGEFIDVDFSAIPDGIYQGTGEGFYGPITVEVEIAGGAVVAINVISQEETPEFYSNSYPLIPERIIEEQSLEVDTSTGATFSAQGIIDAVCDALAEFNATDGGGEE